MGRLNNHVLTYHRRENIGFVFQAYYLVASLTALENVALVADISLNPLHLIDASHIIGLKDSANHFSSKRSGDDQ